MLSSVASRTKSNALDLGNLHDWRSTRYPASEPPFQFHDQWPLTTNGRRTHHAQIVHFSLRQKPKLDSRSYTKTSVRSTLHRILSARILQSGIPNGKVDMVYSTHDSAIPAPEIKALHGYNRFPRRLKRNKQCQTPCRLLHPVVGQRLALIHLLAVEHELVLRERNQLGRSNLGIRG